ncbi:MAG: uracil phosphoribosyltransferase [Phycisphaeraceae bacterium]|nr:uracil phosphoribosyltransferase [Phycisphaeraceae bacterium]
MPNLNVIEHPVVADLLAEARSRETRPGRFRHVVRRLGALLTYEAARGLPTQDETIETPIEAMTTRRLAYPLVIVPILRAGLVMADGALDVLPDAIVGHVGLFRDESNLQPVGYYQKIPAEAASGPVFVIDPMLATGGSVIEAIRRLDARDHGAVTVVCMVAAPEGVERMGREYPAVAIVAGALDRALNDSGFIVPGLGDAGDRMFGT